MTAPVRETIDFIDYYNCHGKDNGQYVHPSDCTRFIICSNGHAFDSPCKPCGDDERCEGEEYLRYNPDYDPEGACDYPANVECITDPPEKPTLSN